LWISNTKISDQLVLQPIGEVVLKGERTAKQVSGNMSIEKTLAVVTQQQAAPQTPVEELS